jgi:hypothetical protein
VLAFGVVLVPVVLLMVTVGTGCAGFSGVLGCGLRWVRRLWGNVAGVFFCGLGENVGLGGFGCLWSGAGVGVLAVWRGVGWSVVFGRVLVTVLVAGALWGVFVGVQNSENTSLIFGGYWVCIWRGRVLVNLP